MHKVRKLLASILIAGLALTQMPAMTASAQWNPTTPVASNAALLINPDTGTVLYSKNADQKVYPASITKLMTAILTVEKFQDLNSVITVQSSDLKPLQGTGSSLMGLKAGEQLTVEQLLYGLLLSSGNDVAMVLARAVGGDVATFSNMMNDKAKQIGCKNTHYVNPHGLQDPEQYSTAYDIYLISKYAMTKDILARIVAQPTYKVQTNTTTYNLSNTNALLKTSNTDGYYYRYCQGIKTGSTTDAGICLSSYATNGGVTYYCVVMQGSGDVLHKNTAFADTVALYKWAFGSFTTKELVEKNSLQAKVDIELAWNKSQVQLVAANQFNALIPSNTDLKTVKIVTRDIPKSVQAPVNKGQKLGAADVTMPDPTDPQKSITLGTVDLVSNESVARSQTLYIFYLIGRFFSSKWFKLVSVMLILLLAAFFVLSFLRARRKRRMMNRRKSKKTYRLPK